MLYTQLALTYMYVRPSCLHLDGTTLLVCGSMCTVSTCISRLFGSPVCEMRQTDFCSSASLFVQLPDFHSARWVNAGATFATIGFSLIAFVMALYDGKNGMLSTLNLRLYHLRKLRMQHLQTPSSWYASWKNMWDSHEVLFNCRKRLQLHFLLRPCQARVCFHCCHLVRFIDRDCRRRQVYSILQRHGQPHQQTFRHLQRVCHLCICFWGALSVGSAKRDND